MTIKNWVRAKLRLSVKYKSETAKVRHLVLPFCKGKGCDIGFGGDKIVKENCDGIDFAQPYTNTGNDKVDIPCVIGKEKIPVTDNYYDYVYSSHLIEDFEDTSSVLSDFIRVLSNNGSLILVFPDQPKYKEHCLATGQPLNLYHIHDNMGLNFMFDVLNGMPGINYEVLYTSDCEIDYNVVLVIRVMKIY
jgi:ubiquinone/menaquinone biosynthesis C-methylase UbiE